MNFYAYIDYMKKRVSLTIDKTILLRAKQYALKNNLTLSKMAEDY